MMGNQLTGLKGIVNARDLGGYPVQGGLRIKQGLLFRSAHLADASEADLAVLAALKIARIVDFRMIEEKKGKENKSVPGSEYIVLPIDATGPVSATATEEEKKKFTGKKQFDPRKLIVMAAFNKKAQQVAKSMYPILLEYPDCQKQFAAFMRLVVDTPEGAILFHCTQGKDRTGIAAMLLLAALGADRDTIIADFDETNISYMKDVRKYSRRVRFFGGKAAELDVVKSILGANTDNFIKALDGVEQHYGSLEGYLKGPIGMNSEDIRILKERYLE